MNRLIIILLFLTSCTKPLLDDGWVRYSTATHYTAHPYMVETNDYVKVAFIPNSTWYYETEHNGWSKILGYSDGHHQQNSNRLVWQCRNNKLYAGYYMYINGISPQYNTEQKGTLLELKCDIKYTAEIYRKNSKYCIKLWNSDTTVMVEYPSGRNSIGYLLFPYVGGKYTIKDYYIDLKIY